MQICHRCTRNIYRQKKIGIKRKKTNKHQFPSVWLLFNEEGLRAAGPSSVSLIGSDPAVSADTLWDRRSMTRSAVLLKVCWTTENQKKKHVIRKTDAACGAHGFQTAPHSLTSAQTFSHLHHTVTKRMELVPWVFLKLQQPFPASRSACFRSAWY